MQWLAATPETWAEAQRIAAARNNAKSPHIRTMDSGYHANPDRAFPHVIGVLGEMAIARLMGWSVDTRIMRHGDDSDFHGVEVKTSLWSGPDIELKIKCSEYDRKRPRAYVLCRAQPSPPKVRPEGFITRRDFECVRVRKNYGYQDNWIVPVRNMTAIESVERLLALLGALREAA